MQKHPIVVGRLLIDLTHTAALPWCNSMMILSYEDFSLHYSPESWQVANMEYLHWGYGICKGCRYVLSIEY